MLNMINLQEVIQAKPSRLPVTSDELFSILDDASERTFLCAGTAESVEKKVFDGEAHKIGFDSKNLVACTSFLFEQKLVVLSPLNHVLKVETTYFHIFISMTLFDLDLIFILASLVDEDTLL